MTELQDPHETQDEADWYGPEAATFGDRLVAAREAAGMTQQTLAKRLGVKLKSLQAWEQDLSEPRANKLIKLAGLLNVTMPWLMLGEGEGLHTPEEETIPPDGHEILTEIRAMRAQLREDSERLGRLEKKLRLLLQEGV
ncbi:MAG: helix-turn-helix domain-containing protein [Pelagimonas sp.]|jgi:transcriptional regulator with XRE-family HTH domain|nr:helix-turn-helix domain-containing protein [Pelagimonas sp.]